MLALLLLGACGFCRSHRTPPLPAAAASARQSGVCRGPGRSSCTRASPIAPTAPAMLVDGDVVRTRQRPRRDRLRRRHAAASRSRHRARDAVARSACASSSGRVVAARLRRGDRGRTSIDTQAAARATRRARRIRRDRARPPRERLEVTVARGVAEVDGRRLATAGAQRRDGDDSRRRRPRAISKRSTRRAGTPSPAGPNDRDQRLRRPRSSARNCRQSFARTAQSFDQYGRWDYVAPYGNVWFPSVGVDWRPYYSGVVATHALRLDVDWPRSAGRGRRITTAAGDSPARRGIWIPDATCGARRG